MKRLQVGIGLLLLLVGVAFVAFHFFEHAESKCGALDGDVKVALGFVAAGLLLLPFDLKNFREFVPFLRKNGSGGAGPPSAPSEEKG